MKKIVFCLIVLLILLIGVFVINSIINSEPAFITEEIPDNMDGADVNYSFDDENWAFPVRAGPVSILNNLVGLIFGGPGEDVEEPYYYELDSSHIMIHNRAEYESGMDIILEPMTLEYRLFRVTATGDELLYSEVFPKLSGILPAGTFTVCSIEIPYWTNENTTPGAYKIQLAFPDNFEYRFVGDDTIHYLPIRGNMYNEFYEFNIVAP